ncbi:MAG: peptidylprolyl isomerase, partial [Ruminococcus sp.]|nr:peptidylprolyl isomerase [Ruminococcus sp.]
SIDSLRASGYSLTEDAAEIYRTAGGTPFLDGSYTVFGQVIDGLDVVFEIQKTETDTTNDKPVEDVVIDSVTVEKYDGSDIKWFISDYDTASDDTSGENGAEDSYESEDTEAYAEE